MSKDLKAFVRFDGHGDIVPGTLVVQSFKPKVGKWEEISMACCGNTRLSRLSGVIIRNDAEFVFRLNRPCVSVTVACVQSGGGLEGWNSCTSIATTLEELIIELNSKFSMFGKFEMYSDFNITLNVASNILTLLSYNTVDCENISLSVTLSD